MSGQSEHRDPEWTAFFAGEAVVAMPGRWMHTARRVAATAQTAAKQRTSPQSKLRILRHGIAFVQDDELELVAVHSGCHQEMHASHKCSTKCSLVRMVYR